MDVCDLNGFHDRKIPNYPTLISIFYYNYIADHVEAPGNILFSTYQKILL